MWVLLLSCFSRIRLCVTPWTVARQAPLSMGFSRQEYCSGVQCSPPGELPDPGIKPAFLMSPALAGRLFATSATWEALWNHRTVYKSRLLLRTLLAAEVDTDPGMPALHMAARPHGCGCLIPALWGTRSRGQTWRTLQEGFFWGEDMPPDPAGPCSRLPGLEPQTWAPRAAFPRARGPSECPLAHPPAVSLSRYRNQLSRESRCRQPLRVMRRVYRLG